MADRDPERVRTLIATGDVIPARNVDSRIRARGNDFLYPVAETAEVLRAADLTLINLEAPLIEDCPPHPGRGFRFCGQAGFVEALVHAGVDVAGLENNHIGNFGPDGVAATAALLQDHGIDYADRGTLAVRDVRGLRFGFLAFNGVGEPIDRAGMVAMIEQATEEADVVVVSCHWGREYSAVPQAAPGLAPDDPVEIAHLAIDAGADLVIGNHPHWVQAVELYEGKLIAYAHGNFVFDQAWSLPTRQGVVGHYTFYDDQLVGVEYLPVLIEDGAQPRFLEGDDAQAVLDRMYEASRDLAEQLQAGLRWSRQPILHPGGHRRPPLHPRRLAVPGERRGGRGVVSDAAVSHKRGFVTYHAECPGPPQRGQVFSIDSAGHLGPGALRRPDHLVDESHQLVDIERLDERPVLTIPSRIGPRPVQEAPVSRRDDDRQPARGRRLLEPLQQLPAGSLADHQVDDHQVGGEGRDAVERLRDVVGRRDVERLVLEELAHQAEELRCPVHHEHVLTPHLPGFAPSGRLGHRGLTSPSAPRRVTMSASSGSSAHDDSRPPWLASCAVLPSV